METKDKIKAIQEYMKESDVRQWLISSIACSLYYTKKNHDPEALRVVMAEEIIDGIIND